MINFCLNKSLQEPHYEGEEIMAEDDQPLDDNHEIEESNEQIQNQNENNDENFDRNEQNEEFNEDNDANEDTKNNISDRNIESNKVLFIIKKLNKYVWNLITISNLN